MPITTLFDFWTNEEMVYTALVKNAQAAVVAAGKLRDTAVTANASAATDIAAAQAEIAAIKAKLAADVSPADADADAKKLRELVAKLRGASGGALGKAADLSDKVAAVARAQTELDRATAKRDAATAQLAQATARKTITDNWATALAASPLKDVKANAGAAQTGQEHAAAAVRIAHDFPPHLFALTQRRRAVLANRLAKLDTTLSDTRGLIATQLAGAGPAAAVEGARMAWQLAFEPLGAYVRGASAELDRAITLLVSVTSSAVLTPDELADVTSGPAEVAGDPVIGTEDARNTAKTTAVNADYTLEKDTVAAQAPDPTADISSKVAADKTAADAAKTDLDTVKEPAFSTGAGSAKSKLAAWEAALPDTAFTANAAFQEAEEILARLASTDGPTLLSTFTTAEADLVTALIAAAKAERSLAYLQDTLAQQSARKTARQAARQDELFSFMRGDS
jgi:hypothetical protein